MNEHEKQAKEFLEKTGVELTVKYVGNDLYFSDDKQPRDIYRFNLSRAGIKYTARFGQSIANSKNGNGRRTKPTAYEILASLDIVYSETIDDFAKEFGYEIVKPSVINRIWSEIQEQNAGLRRLFSERELELLSQIN